VKGVFGAEVRAILNLAAVTFVKIEYNNCYIFVNCQQMAHCLNKQRSDGVRRVDLSAELMAELQSMKRKRQAYYFSW
jgi:hypothetical protein